LLRQRFELALSTRVDSDDLDRCRIFTKLPLPTVLPREARALYNVLMSCEDGVTLRIAPEVRLDPEVLVEGVSTVVPIEEITGMILLDALQRVGMTADAVHQQLTTEEGHDHWGACETDADEDDDF
jgi:hypothetical protein